MTFFLFPCDFESSPRYWSSPSCFWHRVDICKGKSAGNVSTTLLLRSAPGRKEKVQFGRRMGGHWEQVMAMTSKYIYILYMNKMIQQMFIFAIDHMMLTCSNSHPKKNFLDFLYVEFVGILLQEFKPFLMLTFQFLLFYFWCVSSFAVYDYMSLSLLLVFFQKCVLLKFFYVVSWCFYVVFLVFQELCFYCCFFQSITVVDRKFYRTHPYLMLKSMVSCRFSHQPNVFGFFFVDVETLRH